MRIGNTIYLDHQATTPADPCILHRMAPFFKRAFGNPHSTDHIRGWEAAQAVEGAAASVAALIGADSDEIIFTSGATEANNLALLGLGRRAAKGKRKRVLVSAVEHKCVLGAARALAEWHGFAVETVPVDGAGRVDLARLAAMLADDVLLVSVMAVNNEIGTIQDVEAIGGLARRHGARFHCDAAQAPLAMDLGGLARHVDLLSLSAHKMYGPMGVGALYVARELQGEIEPLFYGGGQQNGLRSGTVPVALCVGLAAAAELAGADDAPATRAALRRRRDSFVAGLRRLRWPIAVNGCLGQAGHPGNASICFQGFAAQDLLGALQPRLAASTGAACASGIPEPSHVLRAIGLDAASADATIRFSLGHGTTDADISDALALLEEALANLAPSR